MPAICCGLTPMLFGRKAIKLVQEIKTNQVSKSNKKPKKIKGSKKDNSSQSACNFILMMELRKKIIIFRDIIDLPPCITSVSTEKLLIGTMKDLHKYYPESIPKFRRSKLKRLPLDKVLIYFCKALQELRDTSNMGDERIDKYKYDTYENDKCKNVEKLVEIAVATLNGLIKIAREKFDMLDEDEENKDVCLKTNTFGNGLKESYSEHSSSCPSPTSILPELMNASLKPSYSSPLMLSLKVQAVGKLNPIDVKRLTLHMLPKMGVQFPSCLNQNKIVVEEQKEEVKHDFEVMKESIVDETGNSISTPQNETLGDQVSDSDYAAGDTTTDGSNEAAPIIPPLSPLEMQPPVLSGGIEVAAEESASPPATPVEVLSPVKLSSNMGTDVSVVTPPAASSADVLSPTTPSEPRNMSINMEIDIRSIPPPPPMPPRPSFLQPNVVSGEPAIPPPPPLSPLPQPNAEAAQSTPVAIEPALPPPLSTLTETAATGIPLPPPPPPVAPLKSNVVATGTPLPPAPPVPLQLKVVASGAPPPTPPISASGITPSPPPMMLSKGSGPLPPPPPPMMLPKGSGPMPPPPTSMSPANGAAPPPPPPGASKFFRLKKANTKLKRSSHMGNLYRVLKGKVEGFPVQGPSSQGKKRGTGGSAASGKQGMADALAEMTKRSAYFQQIEEDVQKYAKSITELRTTIGTFKTSDMRELLKFHKYVESILEKLTDETQVLARFEGFPVKKLEALRTASALYSKLESMMNELKNWKVEPPLALLLDKVERYFDKIKRDVDALERTKDEEAKKFKSHNIEFDFQILVRIKEAIVDVSSNCMELTLKERREAKLAENEEPKTKGEAQKKVCSKMLWRAFQFAFRVYTFAGGHDDRADRLTRELAHEIETDPEHQQ